MSRFSFLLSAAAWLLCVHPAAADLLRIDFNHPGSLTEPDYEPLSADDFGLGDSWTRNDLPLEGGGTATIRVEPVGSVTLDTRDRSSSGNGEPFDLWVDFLFANGSDAAGDGIDITLTGFAANKVFPVRIHSYDTVSSARRGSLWNGVSYTFDGSDPEPFDLNEYFVDTLAVTDGSGQMRIEGRTDPATGTLTTHNVFINALTIGDPLSGPTDVTLSTVRIHTGLTVGGEAAVLGVLQPDGVQSVTYSLVAGEGAADNALFSVEGDRLRLAAALPGGTGTALTIRLRATDSNNQSVERAFALTVVNDADADLLDDAWELTYFPSLDVATADGDNDGDTLTNAQELLLGTNPANADTDGDSLGDRVETGTGVFVDVDDTGTSPFLKDSDRDGIDDNVEIAGSHGFATDPNVGDTDGDGFLDGDEIARGTSPVDPASRPSDDPLEFLIACWPLDSLDGTEPMTTPELKNGLAMTAHFMDASAVVPGKFGSALEFDGLDDILTWIAPAGGGPLPVSQFPSWTVSLWVNAIGTGQSDLRFFSEGSTLSNTPLLNIGTHNSGADDSIDLLIRGSGTATHQHSFIHPLDGEGWHHIALVKDAVDFTISLYIDGEPDLVMDFTDPSTGGRLNTVSIGGIQRAVQSHFVTGRIDEVSLWRGPLTPAQVAELAAATGPLEIEPTPPVDDESFAVTEVSRDAANGNVSLTWESEAGRFYRIEVSADPAGTWQELPGTLAGKAGTTSTDITQGLPAGGRVFVRVIRLPEE